MAGWNVLGHLAKRPSDSDVRLNGEPFATQEQAARFRERMLQMGYRARIERASRRAAIEPTA